ncbi:unnamed protein product [Candida verbasci]|uniref:LAA1-like C-terminal TPR repeats domain-containing protein n=1 Tax=Candida verbasci TaxID=1227364 RepID=A0A9W4XEK3_9ASCO|nr:unnamed protein product [Candida verbasci]
MEFDSLLHKFNNYEIFNYLTNLSGLLSNDIQESDYHIYFSQLYQIMEKFHQQLDQIQSKKKKDEIKPEIDISSNLFKLLSRNLILVLQKLPSKVNDLTNQLLNSLTLINDELSKKCQISIMLLIDLFENFPSYLGSLINYAISQIYKIIKKYPNIDSSLIYLLNSVTKNATKSDIDDKTQTKLLKIVTKSLFDTVSFTQDCSSTVLVKKNYILCYRNLLLLAVSTNYEVLLAGSTSSSSAGAKMKPEAIMTQQHQFQVNLLQSNEKYFNYCLSNYSKEVRIAMVELLAYLLLNFVPTGKYNPIEYLIALFPLQNLNIYDSTLTTRDETTEIRKETNTISNHDSDAIIESNVELSLFQSSVVETFIFYIQLEQFQNHDYLSNNLINILDLILKKFDDLNNAQHVQNQQWNLILQRWSIVIEYMIQETGSTGHEVLCDYLYNKFSQQTASKESKERKRESKLFFKPKTKQKDLNNASITPYTNSYQTYLLLYIVNMLLPYGVNFAEKEKESSFIKDTLLNLIVNNNSYIRNYALQSLLGYAETNQAEINQLILQIFKLVDQEYKHSDKESSKGEENICPISLVRLTSYSLGLSALIKQTDPALLQNSAIVKILSFCTQNLKHNTTSNVKNTSCWIILSSLVSLYNFSEYVKLNSSQFLVFWKSLLTSQFISGSTIESQTNEIMANLKLRSLSVLCLLNYLNSVDSTPESLKQIQFLLTKSYNYLSYLESNIDSVGAITTFSNINFNESNYNPNILNNILYTNYSYNQKISQEKMMINLIVYNKKIILQGFTKLTTIFKGDINSNTIIFLIRIFSDVKLFSRVPPNENEKVSKRKGLGKVADYTDEDAILLNEDYNYSFGVTSKLKFNSKIDELLIKFPFEQSHQSTNWLRKTFTKKVKELPNTSIEGNSEPKLGSWFDNFEDISFASVDNSINYDPNILLTQDYSSQEKYSTNLVISLVDLSIELFQLVFPQLSTKIQFSLLEQIRNSLSGNQVDNLRLKAVKLNVSVALHGLLSNIIKKKLTLENEITLVIIDVIKKIDTKNSQLIKINSSSIGLAVTLLKIDDVSGQIASFVNEIVAEFDPYKRSFAILVLSEIYATTKIGFNDVYNILVQLLCDPNPIIYHYSLLSLIEIFEVNLDKLSLIPNVLDKLYSNYLDDNFGYNLNNMMLINLRSEYSSISLTTRLLKLFVSSLGPALKDWQDNDKQKLKNLITSLSYGIGLATLDDTIEVYKYLLALFQELIIFDQNLIEGEINFFTRLLNLIISKNLKVSIATVSPTFLNIDAIFPFNSSFDLYSAAYECYYELIKIFGVDILSNETANLLWVSMNIQPCDTLKSFIRLWLESSLDKNWFTILNSLFKVSSKKLTGKFIETNYSNKLLPLSQRGKKKVDVDLRDEEIENIVGEESEDKNEPISWEFKLFIYELLNHLLEIAKRNTKLVDKLKSKIQDIVKLSFLGSTSRITEIKLQGIELLDRALGLFGELADPLYPTVSILEQQQAQIISALVPCFTPGNDYKVIVEAIHVASKFINLPKIKFYSKQRILKTLIYLLEEISSNKFLKFGFLENMSEFGKKSIQLSISNCWAILKIESINTEVEPEFNQILDKYSTLLNSLWILALREYSALKYRESSSRELQMYQNCFLNFITILTLELEINRKDIEQHLGGDAQNFFFILFSQCVESLIKNKDTAEILVTVNRLVQNPDLVELLFNDQIFGEIIDLFDRLILIDDNTEIQCNLITITTTIYKTFLENNKENLEKGFDKLFELIRVVMLPLFKLLPFLKSDFDPHNANNKLLIARADSASNLLVLKKVFENLIPLIYELPDLVKSDVYSVILYIFARIYQTKTELLISVIIPYLKNIIIESKKFGLIELFYGNVKETFTIDSEKHYTVITTLILLTNGDIQLDEKDSIMLSEALINLLENSNTAATGIQCVKSLIQYSKNNYVIKSLISILVRHAIGSENKYSIDLKVSTEILMLFTKTINEENKLTALYSILIPLLVKSDLDQVYLQDKLIFLIKHNSECFKKVANKKLTDSQRKNTEEIVRLDTKKNGTSHDEHDKESEIQLKTFGV